MFEKRCHFCNEKFKSRHLEKIKSDEHDDGVFACRDCTNTYALKKLEGKSDEIETDINHPFDLAEVTTIINNTSAQINLFYIEAQMVDTKLFVSKKNKDKKKNKDQNKNEFSPIVTKDKQKPILRNHI